MTGRAVFKGPDGSARLLVLPGEGEFVCAACDHIVIAASAPSACPACSGERIETLTSIRPAAPGGLPHG